MADVVELMDFWPMDDDENIGFVAADSDFQLWLISGIGVGFDDISYSVIDGPDSSGIYELIMDFEDYMNLADLYSEYLESGWAGLEEEDFDEVFAMNNEEGNAPIQDPMEFGEMANWTPLDGTPSLKRRKNAEYNVEESEELGYLCDVCDEPTQADYNFQDINVKWTLEDGDFTGEYEMKDHLGDFNDFLCQPCAERMNYEAENRQPPWSSTNPKPNRRIECGVCDARGFIAGKECTKCDGAGYWNIASPRCATCETDIQWTDGAECDGCDEWYCELHIDAENGQCLVCEDVLSFHSESSFMTPDLLWENLGGWWKAVGINPDYDMGQSQGQQQTGGGAGAAAGSGESGESEGQAQQEQEQEQEGHRGHGDSSQPVSPHAAEGMGEINIGPVYVTKKVPVLFKHDYVTKDYEWSTDEPRYLTDDQESEVVEIVEQIVEDTDAIRGNKSFDEYDYKGEVSWNTYKDDGRFYDLAAEGDTYISKKMRKKHFPYAAIPNWKKMNELKIAWKNPQNYFTPEMENAYYEYVENTYGLTGTDDLPWDNFEKFVEMFSQAPRYASLRENKTVPLPKSAEGANPSGGATGDQIISWEHNGLSSPSGPPSDIFWSEEFNAQMGHSRFQQSDNPRRDISSTRRKLKQEMFSDVSGVVNTKNMAIVGIAGIIGYLLARK